MFTGLIMDGHTCTIKYMCEGPRLDRPTKLGKLVEPNGIVGNSRHDITYLELNQGQQ